MWFYIFFIVVAGVLFAYRVNRRFIYLMGQTKDLKQRVSDLEEEFQKGRVQTISNVEKPKVEAELLKRPTFQQATEIPIVKTPPIPPQSAFEYKPDPVTIAFRKIRDYFMSGNTLVKVGVVLTT